MRLVLLSALLLLLASLNVQAQPSDTSECKVKGAGIRFRPLSAGPPRSFFLLNELPNIGQKMVPSNPEIQLLKYLPRIVVQVIDSNGDVERSRNRGVVNVTIIGTGNRYDVGSSVEIKRGEAHFDQIVISQAAADGFVRLRFTAYSPGSNAIPAPPFDQDTLDTGSIKVISGSEITDTHKLAFSVNESLVKYEGDPVPFVSGKALKTIRVNLLTTALLISTSETTQQGLSVGVQLSNNKAPDGSDITITGGEARLRDLDGVAVFSNLRIYTTATSLPGYFLRFNMTTGSKELFLESGELQPFQVNAKFDDSNIGFMTAADSFMYTENQHGLIAKVGTAFPPIRIQLLDKSFYPSTSQFTGLIVTATCDRSDLFGGTVGVVGGVATFDQLMFPVSDITDFNYRPYVITFTAGAQGGLDVVGKKLYTGYIEVANRPEENVTQVHSLRFDQNPFNSYFNAPNVDSQFALYNVLPRPIQIQLLDGANELSDAAGVSVKLTVQGTTVQVPQDTESFSQGIARFSSVLFKQEQDIPARLIFTVTYNNQRLRLLTGEITLSARTIPASDMRFQPFGGSTISREGIDLFATKGYPMLPIVVEVLDSAGAKKPYDSEMGITATAEGATLSNNFVRVRAGSGNAIFDSLTFVSDTPGTFIITFTAQTSTATGVNGKTLTTGKVLMTNVVTPSFRIQFDKETSYIAFEGDSRPIQSATAPNYPVIPDIVVRLVDSIGNPLNLDDSVSLEVSVTTSSGRITTTAASTQPLGKDGKAIFSGLKLINAFDPVLTFCVANKDTSKFSPADGQCISSGSMPFYEVEQKVAALKILASDPRDAAFSPIPSSDLKIRAPASNYSILSGEPIRLIVGVINSQGALLGASSFEGLKIEASSDVALSGSDISAEVDDLTGVAVFNDLFISDRVPIGVTPIITFSASSTSETSQQRVPALSTGLLTIVGSGGTTTGTYVIAEILTDFATFDFTTWQTSVAYLLNIETARIRQVRITPGKGNDQKDVVLTQTEDSVTSNAKATWEGTRVEFMFLDPLPTSENLKSSAELADLFTNLKTSKLNENQPVCGATSPLMLRDAYIRGANNGTCDWGIFDDQMAGARQCLETQGLDGYCQCYVPLFETIAPRCIGLAELTDLCLDILGPLADCYKDYEPIAEVCKQVEFPDAPRLVVGASGAFLMLALPPVLYLAEGSFFKKVARPQAGAGKIAKTEFIRADQEDML